MLGKTSSYLLFCGILTTFNVGCFEAPSETLGPVLEMGNPVDLGQSPIGIRKRETVKLRNVGDTQLDITDFKIEPDDGTFWVEMEQLPLVIERDAHKEMRLTFLPTEEGPIERTLTFSYESQYAQPKPISLKGKGVANLVCLPCSPPPAPECGLDGESSVYYETTTPTDCENEEGICSYLIFEILCEDVQCQNETGRCEGYRPPVPDAGAPTPAHDAGSVTAVDDAGTDNLVNDSGTDSPLHDAGLSQTLVSGYSVKHMRFVLMLFANAPRDTVPSMEAPDVWRFVTTVDALTTIYAPLMIRAIRRVTVPAHRSSVIPHPIPSATCPMVFVMRPPATATTRQ